MKYILLFLLFSSATGTLAPVPGAPAHVFDSLTTCEETRDHRIVRASYQGIYGDDLVMVCVPVEGGKR